MCFFYCNGAVVGMKVVLNDLRLIAGTLLSLYVFSGSLCTTLESTTKDIMHEKETERRICTQENEYIQIVCG